MCNLFGKLVDRALHEKDCLGEDGQAAECTICMEDYEVGQTLARLECLWWTGHSIFLSNQSTMQCLWNLHRHSRRARVCPTS
jgi:hypothetical protein